MQSRYGALFNHDPWADNYDLDVQNERDPVRTAYGEVLAWTVAQAAIGPGDVVVDLGAGTGNTALLIPQAAAIICVDLSARMIELARPKLAHRPEVRFVQADLLGFFDDLDFGAEFGAPAFDALVSTYAVHHLTEDEKDELFHRIARHLRPGGRAAFGDLMVLNRAERDRLVDYYRELGDADTVEGLTEEFFWIVEGIERRFADAGLAVTALRRFSTLSWGVSVRNMADAPRAA
ncbi:MAG TPA: class I SAM-dependent methyltransferase [Caldilineaceae bacterium]|nr:class I SAM-dependent methyltransferase [Caldilineaceae bacterium]